VNASAASPGEIRLHSCSSRHVAAAMLEVYSRQECVERSCCGESCFVNVAALLRGAIRRYSNGLAVGQPKRAGNKSIAAPRSFRIAVPRQLPMYCHASHSVAMGQPNVSGWWATCTLTGNANPSHIHGAGRHGLQLKQAVRAIRSVVVDTTCMRWSVAHVHQCGVHTEVQRSSTTARRTNANQLSFTSAANALSSSPRLHALSVAARHIRLRVQ